MVAATTVTIAVPASAGVQDGKCRLTGDASNVTGDHIAVHALGIDFDASGQATLTTAGGDVYELDVNSLSCRRDGGGGPGAPAGSANIANIEGTATKNGVPGYEYGAQFHDLGEGTLKNRLADTWTVTILHGSDIDYSDGGFAIGNFQIQT